MVKKTAAPEADETPEPAPAIASMVPAPEPDEDGYYPDADWVRIECDWDSLKPREGFKPLWAEFDVSLSFEEALRIPNPFATPIGELYPHVCPRVRAWNVKRRNPETGKLEPVPSPMEAGPDAFRGVKPAIVAWLASTLMTVHLRGGVSEKKEPTETSASGDGPSGPSGES